jgi:hypothetical protein
MSLIPKSGGFPGVSHWRFLTKSLHGLLFMNKMGNSFMVRSPERVVCSYITRMVVGNSRRQKETPHKAGFLLSG